jgi:hypothetical protein
MLEAPQAVQEAVRRHVLADLQPSRRVVLAKLGVAFGLGAVVAAAICNYWLMGGVEAATGQVFKVPTVAMSASCAVACGAVFAVVPLLALRFLTGALQFRAILKQSPMPQAGWLTAMTILFATHVPDPAGYAYLAIWAVTVALLFRGLPHAAMRLRLRTAI